MKQYELTHDFVNYGILEVTNIHPVLVNIRPGRPRELRLKKLTPYGMSGY